MSPTRLVRALRRWTMAQLIVFNIAGACGVAELISYRADQLERLNTPAYQDTTDLSGLPAVQYREAVEEQTRRNFQSAIDSLDEGIEAKWDRKVAGWALFALVVFMLGIDWAWAGRHTQPEASVNNTTLL